MAMDNLLPFRPPEWWGGIECTVNRTGDIYKNQLLLSNHYGRSDDIEKIAGLGITTLRYPVLWEVHQPSLTEPVKWDQTEEKLKRIKLQGMQIIAGLVHHRSGPLFTSLEDPGFPEKLAAYAGVVAKISLHLTPSS